MALLISLSFGVWQTYRSLVLSEQSHNASKTAIMVICGRCFHEIVCFDA
jgi:hypothetical protein